MHTNFDFVKRQGGFSLAELLIYIGIVGIVAGLMTGIVSTVTKTQVEESAQNEVTGQLNFAMQTIQRLVRESSLIDLAAGTATSTLTLRMKTPSQDPTLIYLSGGRIYIQQGAGGAQVITSDTVVVDALEFKKFTQYPAKDVVQIDLALSNATQASGRTVSRSLRSAVSRVSAATFDSDLLPGSDDSFKIGLTSGNRWEQGRFSKGISIGTAETYRTTSPPTGGMIIEGNVGIGTTTPAVSLQVQQPDSAYIGISIRSNVTGHAPLLEFVNRNTYTNNISMDNLNNIAIAPSSGNVGIGTTTPATLFTVATTTNVLNVTSGGRVGIGTTTPSEKLTVNGNIRLLASSTVTGLGAPVNPSDAATKAYVDAAGGGSSFNGKSATCSSDGCTATTTCDSGTVVVNSYTSYGSPAGTCTTAVVNWPKSSCWGASSCNVTDVNSCAASRNPAIYILCGK